MNEQEQDKKILELIMTFLRKEGMSVYTADDILDPEVEKLIIGKDSPEKEELI